MRASGHHGMNPKGFVAIASTLPAIVVKGIQEKGGSPLV